MFIKLHRLSLKVFPAFEKYELSGQLRRSAFSVAVNIVEGFATEHGRIGYVDEKAAGDLDLEIRRVGAPLAGLIASERRKITTQTAGVIAFIFLLGSRLL